MSRHRQAGKSFSTDGGRHMKIGLQLYTLRGNIKNGDDLLKILSDVKKLGFEGVEFAGYFGLDANTLNTMQPNTMTAPSRHTAAYDFKKLFPIFADGSPAKDDRGMGAIAVYR